MLSHFPCYPLCVSPLSQFCIRYKSLAGLYFQSPAACLDSNCSNDRIIEQEFELKPKHLLVSATAVKNRVFILTVSSSSLQWRKAKDKLKAITPTFFVNTA